MSELPLGLGRVLFLSCGDESDSCRLLLHVAPGCWEHDWGIESIEIGNNIFFCPSCGYENPLRSFKAVRFAFV